MKNALYMTDSYLKEFEATVESVKDDKFIILNQTTFYPNGGGQPHDTGILVCNGEEYPVVFVGKFSGQISHEVSKPGLKVGDKIQGKIDWERRYRHMRMHTAAHIIDAILYNEAGALCTGNQLGLDKSRIDFSLDVLDRDKIQKYVDMSNEWVRKAIDVKIYSLPREEALKIPGVVKLASVMPPEVSELRIVEIPDIDLQADGGTQVKNTYEIGNISLVSVENKGKNNRRMYFTLD
ncbi:MAG TPA: alanyl-tRNA editing protein AlaXM [Candidatus Nanoarchaeia archaeon]|nr:alanyl-tRNA editing protein AlaXM [Candidatus Nanoarchaeia archaeon]